MYRTLLRFTLRAIAHLVIAILFFVLGILLHEYGHGIVATFFGAQVERINVVSVQVWPSLRWDPPARCHRATIFDDGLPQAGYWGRIWWRGDLTAAQERLGLPMYLFFGTREASMSEGYLAATALGCPGPLFQGLIIGYSLLAITCIAYKLIRLSVVSSVTKV